MSLKIEYQNKDGFRQLLNGMGRAFGESTLRKAAAAGATVVKDEAKFHAPRGPLPHHQGPQKFPIGFGADNIIVAFNEEKSVDGKMATYMVTFAKDAYYLRFYEYGASQMAARPFFRPAIEATHGLVNTRIDNVIEEALRKAGVIT